MADAQDRLGFWTLSFLVLSLVPTPVGFLQHAIDLDGLRILMLDLTPTLTQRTVGAPAGCAANRSACSRVRCECELLSPGLP